MLNYNILDESTQHISRIKTTNQLLCDFNYNTDPLEIDSLFTVSTFECVTNKQYSLKFQKKNILRQPKMVIVDDSLKLQSQLYFLRSRYILYF